MDLTQATQMINWLEAERLKDKTALATLQERANGLAADLAEQSKHIQALQNELADAKTNLSKLSQFDRHLEQFKADLVGEMDRRKQDLEKLVRESDRLRTVESDATNRTLTEIRKDLLRIKPLEEEMLMRRAEERRLNDVLTGLDQRAKELAVRTEDRVQKVVFLEEGRSRDAQRIAQLEEGNTNTVKRMDALVVKVTLLEDKLQRMPAQIDEGMRRIAEQDKVVEEMRRNDFRRAQDVKAFMEDVNKMLVPVSDYIARYQTDYQRMQELAATNQRALEQLDAFRVRIETRQAEIAEMQRLGEERMKKQVEEWQAAEEKRWKRQTLTWLEQWQEHDRWHESWETRLETIEQASAEHARQFKAVWNGLEEWAKVYLSAARQVVEAQHAMLEDGRPSKPTARSSTPTTPDKKE